MDYTFDQAAALLNMGRNTLIRRLREKGMLGKDNLPAGRWRGHGAFRVITRTYTHPVLGYRHYGKTLITKVGFAEIRRHFEKTHYPPERDKTTGYMSSINPAEESSMDSNPATPARLHDIGELTVINEDHGRCHHKVAMVLIFDSLEEAAACMKSGLVRLVPANDLNPEVMEHLSHGG